MSPESISENGMDLECEGEFSQVVLTWDIKRAERACVIIGLLDIQKHKSLLAEVINQRDECHFRAIADAGKHRFCGKKSADLDAIDAADELFVMPAFDTMCVSHVVKLGVGLDHGGADPRIPAFFAWLCASADHLGKTAIARKVVRAREHFTSDAAWRGERI